MESYRPRYKEQPSEPPSLLPRPDDRAANAVRPTYLRTGVVHGAAGSAYLEQRHTKLVCAVYGPRYSRRAEYSESGTFTADLKYAASAQHKRRRRGQGEDEREGSAALTAALTPAIRLSQYPKSYIEAYVLVLEDDGNTLAAAMTAVSLALADAQVEMLDMLAATSSHLVAGSPRGVSAVAGGERAAYEVLLDCTADERRHASHTAALTLAYMPNTRAYPHLQMHGCLPVVESVDGGGGGGGRDWMDVLMEAAVAGCEALVAAMREALREGMVRKVKEAEAKEALERKLTADVDTVAVSEADPMKA